MTDAEIGSELINQIITSKLFNAVGTSTVVIVWSANASEQLGQMALDLVQPTEPTNHISVGIVEKMKPRIQQLDDYRKQVTSSEAFHCIIEEINQLKDWIAENEKSQPSSTNEVWQCDCSGGWNWFHCDRCGKDAKLITQPSSTVANVIEQLKYLIMDNKTTLKTIDIGPNGKYVYQGRIDAYQNCIRLLESLSK